MTRIWEFEDNRAIPSDLVREQDFILRLRRLQRLGSLHFVVNLMLSAMAPLAKSRRALEAVEEQLREFAKVTNGTYADMSNGDVFIIWEETTDAPLLASRLLSVVLPEGHTVDDAQKYIQVYNLPADYTRLRERANHYVEVVHTTVSSTGTMAPAEALKSEAARGPLTAWSIDQIGKLMGDIDLNHYARTQPIYESGANGLWKVARAEYFISFEDLRRERFPKLDVIAPEHLFLALCEKIDQHLLTSLHENPAAISGHAVNLNLSVATVMGSIFAQFAMKMSVDQRHLICFELHRGDLLQDFARTLGAIETIRKEGFKVALDGITPDMIGYINLGAFNVDYIKINVASDRTAQLNDPAIRKGLAELPPKKLIFYHCDNEQALAAGRQLGVTLFQGWLIDDIVSGKHKS